MVTRTGIDFIKEHPPSSRRAANAHRAFALDGFDSHCSRHEKNPHQKVRAIFHGDPYGNRTHVTAVKGRCLNRLTNGPGSGNLIRTDDIPGMNRVLYQLSYAAMCGQMIPAPPKSASLLYPVKVFLSSLFLKILNDFAGERHGGRSRISGGDCIILF